jgi:hypothetical protein
MFFMITAETSRSSSVGLNWTYSVPGEPTQARERRLGQTPLA